MNKTVKTAALLLAAVMLLLSGCRSGTGGTSSLQAPTDSNTSDGYRDYITLLYSSSDSFNPYTVKTDTNRQLCRLLYEPLVKLDNEFNPDYYYQTRSFELIKRMEIIGKDIYVIYDGIRRTKDEDFD